MEVLLFPYLPLAQPREVGPWKLIPREQLTAEDSIGERIVELAQGVAKLYRLPGHDRGYGAFIRRADQPVGEEINPDRLRTLYHAVVVSLLDENPSRAVAGILDDDNSGHRMCTTENALLFGHRFDDELYTGFETGTMVVMRHLGPKIGEAESVIPPPADMHLPVMRPQFDPVYAQALYEVLSAPSARTTRICRARSAGSSLHGRTPPRSTPPAAYSRYAQASTFSSVVRTLARSVAS